MVAWGFGLIDKYWALIDLLDVLLSSAILDGKEEIVAMSDRKAELAKKRKRLEEIKQARKDKVLIR